MKAFYCDTYTVPLPAGHRFPMERYRLLRERVEQLAGVQLQSPPAVSREQLANTHTPEYLDKIWNGTLEPLEARRLGLPWSPQLLERSRRSVGATLAAARVAWHERGERGFGVAVNLAGGTHHAFADRGEGFCVFNDCVVSARQLLSEGVRRVVIVDGDVHQGDGTASLCSEDSRIWTFSLHGQNNYPFHKQKSSLDLELPDACNDATYLEAWSRGLEQAWLREPELVFFLAGADPYCDDRLGRLGVTAQGLAERDRLVFAGCQARGCALVVTMAGGYARQIADTADIQATTVRLALESWLRHFDGD